MNGELESCSVQTGVLANGAVSPKYKQPDKSDSHYDLTTSGLWLQLTFVLLESAALKVMC